MTQTPGETEVRAQQALELVGMTGQIDAGIFDLGRGHRERLVLNSVLALHPRLLVIDEPTTGQAFLLCSTAGDLKTSEIVSFH